MKATNSHRTKAEQALVEAALRWYRWYQLGSPFGREYRKYAIAHNNLKKACEKVSQERNK